ncbi:MAG TPA: Ig-like domain-containing protein, partial [Herpetosiphonaceae bacterium]|nr:Ig-like domain-containing protein [Herpetosiphonaceae bacterium]
MQRRRLLILAGLALAAGFVAVVLLQRSPRVAEIAPEPLATPTSPPPATPLPTQPRAPYTPVPDSAVSPVVVERAPARGEELAPDAPIKLVFDRPMDRGAVAGALDISPKVGGELVWSDDRTVSFRPDTPWDRKSVVDVVLGQGARARDGAVLNSAYQFRVTTAGYLEVAQVVPAQGTQDAQATSSITVIFNRPVVALRTVEEQDRLPQPLRLQRMGSDERVAGDGEWLNTSIYVFQPRGALVGGATYDATVDAALQDSDGNPMQNAFSWQFRVAPPKVLATQPQSDATLVGVDEPLRVELNQPAPGTGAVLRLAAGGASVPGTIGTLGQTLVFTPSQRLQFDTTYTAEIPAGSTGLPQPFRWSFRTVPLPRIESTRPADGEQHAPPYSAFEIKFNAPIDPGTVERNLEWTPALTETQIYTSYNDFDRTFYLNLGTQPSTDYEVRIGPDIADPYGNTTGERRRVRFRTDPLPPSVNMVVPEQVGTYNAAEPARLLLQSVNSTEATLSLYRITTTELMRSSWYDSPPSPQNRLRQWTVALASPLDERVITPVDLVEGGGKLEPGAYLVALEDIPDPWLRYHMLVVSDLNLTLKAGEREALVWANRLGDGQPAANVVLTFFTGEGARLGTATTGADGVARLSFDTPTTSSRYAFAEDPFAAIGDGWSRSIAPHEFGLNQTYGTPPRVVALYTDRPIYRPGQTVRFKGVVRNEQDVRFSLPDMSKPIDVIVRNQNGEEIYRKRLPLSSVGSFDDEIALPADAPLGQYSIGDERTFASSFTVAAYRPPEFSVDVSTPAEEMVRGTASQADVEVEYFFGGAVAGVAVEWHVLAENYRFEPPGLEGYTFSSGDDPWGCFDCWWQPPQPPTPIMTGTATTDAQGTINIGLPADLRWNDGEVITSSVRLTIEATANGRDNSVISGRGELVVHQAQVYAGLAAQSYVSRAGQPAGVDIVTTDTEGNRRPGQQVEVLVERYEWTNRFVQSAGGGGRWESEERRTPVARQTLTIDDRAEADFRFTPDQGGAYRVTARASDGTRVAESSIFLWVAGDEFVGWQRSNNDRLTLISDRTRYTPGETASILIPSPFTGPTWALVTVERGGILKHEVIQLESNSTVYDLPITAEHAPNIFVGVVLFTGADGERRQADYKVGFLPLRVDPVKQSLQVKLQPEGGTELAPGGE